MHLIAPNPELRDEQTYINRSKSQSKDQLDKPLNKPIKYMRKPRVLTEDEKKMVNKLRGEGKSKQDIAKTIGCGLQVIIKYLNEVGDENMKVGKKGVEKTFTQRLNANKTLLYRFIEMYKMGDVYTIPAIAREFDTTDSEVKRMASVLNLDRVSIKHNDKDIPVATKEEMKVYPFSKINKDLTSKTYDENVDLINEIMDMVYMYPHLRQRILNRNIDIIPNQILKDAKTGEEITKFDIVLPMEKAIIINVQTLKEKEQWRNKATTNGRTISEFIMSVGYYHVYYVCDGLESILRNMEDHARGEEERHTSRKLKINWENWDDIKKCVGVK